jgi:holo-[acyl-carrier protein] synthase
VILGVGTDIFAIERMDRALSRRGEALAERLLSPVELERWHASSDRVAFLAKRFAAKEAVLKALGTGLRAGSRWHDISVRNDELGKPEVLLEGACARRLSGLGGRRVWLSLSDEKDYVVAFAIISGS